MNRRPNEKPSAKRSPLNAEVVTHTEPFHDQCYTRRPSCIPD
jgi:hypothetical protein